MPPSKSRFSHGERGYRVVADLNASKEKMVLCLERKLNQSIYAFFF